MGGTKQYIESGGFYKRTYEQIGTTPNGIKITKQIGAANSTTPLYSNTPHTMYAATDKRGTVKRITVYGRKNGRDRFKDIDLGHKHSNIADGKKVKTFTESDMHVHDYDANGVRNKIARKPSKKERRLIMMARNKRGGN